MNRNTVNRMFRGLRERIVITHPLAELFQAVMVR